MKNKINIFKLFKEKKPLKKNPLTTLKVDITKTRRKHEKGDVNIRFIATD